MTRFLFSALVLSALLVSGCGGCGDDAAVEPDAELEPDANADTVAPTTTASPIGGTYRTQPTVTLTADEPATIYWTNDGNEPSTSSTNGESPLTVSGTTIRFFAVDEAGNQESLKRVDYVIDRLGPTAIADFTATPDGNDVDLTWANPTDAGFTDVVVARVTDLSTTLAADGETYAANDTLGASTIVYVGSAEAFTDTARGPGHHTYVAWAHYDTGVYAEGRNAATRIATPTQTCQITIDVTGGTATVATQPANFTLAISSYANTGGAITMDVAVTSGLAGIAFNPKLAFTDVTGTGGAPTIDNDDDIITVDGGPAESFYLGPEGLANGATVTASMAITAAAATAITLDCVVLEDPGIYAGEWDCPETLPGGLVDVRTQVAHRGLPAPSRFGPTPGRRTPTTACAAWKTLLLSPDQRYLYAGPRAGKLIAKIDTTTLTSVGGLDVTVAGTSGSASELWLDPSGRRLYAGVNDGAHGGGPNEGTAASSSVLNLVVEIATADMTEVSRHQVGMGDATHRMLRMKPSPDGRRAAVSIGSNYLVTSNSELHFWDLSTWTELDTDSATAGIQSFALGDIRATSVEFDASGRYAVVATGGEDTNIHFGLVDLTAMTLQALVAPDGNTLRAATWDGDVFWLWVQAQTQLHTLVPSTATIASVGTSGDTSLNLPRAARRVGDRLVIQGNSNWWIVDATTGAIIESFSAFEHSSHVLALTR